MARSGSTTDYGFRAGRGRDRNRDPNSPPLLGAKGIPLRDKVLLHAASILQEAVEQDAPKYSTGYEDYQDRPVAFIREVLSTRLTPDAERMVESVWENPVTIAKAGNSVGKTHAAAHVAATFYKMWADSKVYTAAAPPESNLKLLVWGELGAILENHSEVFATDVTSLPGMRIRRSSQSFVVGLAIPQSMDPDQRKARFSGKHAPHMLFIVDEGDAVPAEIYEAIESCMSGGFARLLIMFNPRQQTGPVYLMEKNKRANVVPLSAFTHPNVVTGKDIIPGAVTQAVTVRRMNEWSRPLVPGETADAECYKVPDHLVGKVTQGFDGNWYDPLPAGWRKVTESCFYYMVLGEYPAIGEDQLISAAWIDRATSNWQLYVARYGETPPQSVRPVLSLDVAELGTDSNVLTLRYGSWVARQQLWGGVDVLVSGDKAIRVYQNRSCCEAFIDATGVGAGVPPHMNRNHCVAHRIMVGSAPDPDEISPEIAEIGRFATVRDLGWWLLREWLRKDQNAAIPPDDLLRDELLTPQYEKRPNGDIKISPTTFFKEKLGRSPDRASSLMLSFCPRPTYGSGGIEVQQYIGHGGVGTTVPGFTSRKWREAQDRRERRSRRRDRVGS